MLTRSTARAQGATIRLVLLWPQPFGTPHSLHTMFLANWWSPQAFHTQSFFLPDLPIIEVVNKGIGEIGSLSCQGKLDAAVCDLSPHSLLPTAQIPNRLALVHAPAPRTAALCVQATLLTQAWADKA